ncbi:MAG: DNA-directed RNA polymerase subunit H [Candidatus Micrarchaeota archaeon]|nr:DNA-directed RNA polymerase subunit H [Candidatus Micrarchaeota archaeon]
MADQSISSHELIPKHKLLSKDDSEKMLAHYHASKMQIPKIKAKDPALAELGAKTGQIVEITRLDGSLYYRLVVA